MTRDAGFGLSLRTPLVERQLVERAGEETSEEAALAATEPGGTAH
jgi:hypothetical protein